MPPMFLFLRLDIPESWQMPQHGIDETEDPRDAAIRESREEAGVTFTSAEILAETGKVKHRSGEHVYLFVYPLDAFSIFEIVMFLFKFTGKEEEINLSGEGTKKPEFREWSWISPEQVVDLMGASFYL
ncbi:hypothetical protein LguiB_035662 [Lonicera macranthoides]